METATTIGLDLAKRSVQAHGALADGSVSFREKFDRPPPLRQWLEDRDSSLLFAGPLVLLVADRGRALHWLAFRGSGRHCDAATTGEWR